MYNRAMSDRSPARRRGLLVIHVDGLSHARLKLAVDAGHMPYVASMLGDGGYEALPYRCGVPSTTPFAQAGILYGDNSEIPSYRWWDKQEGMVIAFGEGSTFGRVANRYFRGRTPLTEGGACIAALYRAGATDRFGPKYEERHTPGRHDAGGRAIAAFLLNPVTLYFWIRHGGLAIFQIAKEYVQARFAGRHPAGVYVIADLYHEVLVHHLTRFAMLQAMDEGLPAIYACFYTYDEASHAFGPTDPNTLRVLRHIDSTIRLAAHKSRINRAGLEYDVAVLSDHGQVETVPFRVRHGRSLGAVVAELLPDHVVTEHRGQVFRPAGSGPGGRVEITYSGGLAHVYLADLPGRLDESALEARFPGLISRLASTEGVGMVMVKAGAAGLLMAGSGRFSLAEPLSPETAALLEPYDSPAILARQLARLNGFERSGDLVVFGAYDGKVQLNFEEQVGGHGSIGGEQLHPFVLVKKQWGFDMAGVTNSSEVNPMLAALRERASVPVSSAF